MTTFGKLIFLGQDPDVPEIWTTAKRVQIPISELATGHLCNILAMLRRTAAKLQMADSLDLAESSKHARGDGAQLAVEQELSALMDLSPEQWLQQRLPQYALLVAEEQKRNLLPKAAFEAQQAAVAVDFAGGAAAEAFSIDPRTDDTEER